MAKLPTGCAKFVSPQAMERKAGCGWCYQWKLLFWAPTGTPTSRIFLLPLLVNCSERSAQYRQSFRVQLCTPYIEVELWKEQRNKIPQKSQQSLVSYKWDFFLKHMLITQQMLWWSEDLVNNQLSFNVSLMWCVGLWTCWKHKALTESLSEPKIYLQLIHFRTNCCSLWISHRHSQIHRHQVWNRQQKAHSCFYFLAFPLFPASSL